MAGTLIAGRVLRVPRGSVLCLGGFVEILIRVNLAIGDSRGMQAPSSGDDFGGAEVPTEGPATSKKARVKRELVEEVGGGLIVRAPAFQCANEWLSGFRRQGGPCSGSGGAPEQEMFRAVFAEPAQGAWSEGMLRDVSREALAAKGLSNCLARRFEASSSVGEEWQATCPSPPGKHAPRSAFRAPPHARLVRGGGDPTELDVSGAAAETGSRIRSVYFIAAEVLACVEGAAK